MNLQSSEVDELYQDITKILKDAGVQNQVLTIIKERFYPPKVTGLVRPRKKQFRATVLKSSGPAILRGPEHHFNFHIANVVPTIDKEYRIIELTRMDDSEPDFALLITNHGADTQEIKKQIYHTGWDALMAKNPDYVVMTMAELELREVFDNFKHPEPAIVYTRWKSNGRFFKGGILQPSRGRVNA